MRQNPNTINIETSLNPVNMHSPHKLAFDSADKPNIRYIEYDNPTWIDNIEQSIQDE